MFDLSFAAHNYKLQLNISAEKLVLMEIIVFIANCLIVVFVWFLNNESPAQSELRSKMRYKTTEESEKNVKRATKSPCQ